MRQSLSLPVALLAATPLLGACANPFGGGDCITIPVPAIRVTVVDGVSKTAPRVVPSVEISDDGWVTVADRESVAEPPVFVGAYNREGHYKVLIRAAGYEDYARGNLRVRKEGSCDFPQTLSFTAELERLP